MKINKVQVFSYISHSDFSYSGYKEEVTNYTNDYILINTDGNRIFKYTKNTTNSLKIKLISLKNKHLNYLVSPLLFLLNNIIESMIITYFIIKYRPRNIFLNGYIQPIIIGIFTYFTSMKIYYIAADWHPLNKNKKRKVSYFANTVVFPAFDYLCCRLSHAVIDYTSKINIERTKYWGKNIVNKSLVYKLKLFDYFKENKNRHNLCFLGQMRKDCGLDIIIENLKSIRSSSSDKIRLVVIGAKAYEYQYFLDLSKKHGVEEFVDFKGFISRNEFTEVLETSFCGINMVTSQNSYTSVTIPGKFFDYIQYGVPVLTSNNIGSANEILTEYKIGQVLKGFESDNILSSIEDLFQNFTNYNENIKKYIKSTEFNFGDYIEEK